MRTVDFAPLSRSTIGFDRLFSMLQDPARLETADIYPPYNIAKTGDQSYRIELAVAGFGPDDIAITAQHDLLTIAGRKADEKAAQYLFQGIAARPFERQFQLADHVQVTRAELRNGMLAIDLVREIPEAMKPQRIPIEEGSPSPRGAGRAA